MKKVFFDRPSSLLFPTQQGKIALPPLELREHIGGDGAFIEIGNRFLHHFKKYGNLKRSDAVLDIGCGSGRMARALTNYLSKSARYEGFDVDKNCIQWCKENITFHYPNFHFQHVDVFNNFYNRNGTIRPDEFIFPYDSESFHFISLTSVFTHMLPPDMEHYFSEISRVLKDEGRCLMTYFLINPESEKYIQERKSNINFFEIRDGYFSTVTHVPERVIAQKEELIRRLHEKYNLHVIEPIHYGCWCGRVKAVDFQDMIIAKK